MTKPFGQSGSQLGHARTVVFGFGILVMVGALLLGLGYSQSEDISWIDALFTSASAVCVTGLVVVDTGSAYTPFGQLVILMLIQLGGLGTMVWSSGLLILLGRRLGLRQKASLKATVPGLELSQFRKLLKGTILFALACEALGAVLLWMLWMARFPPLEALWLAVFHSVSAFCNAGFSLWPDSLMGDVGTTSINFVVMCLIVLGGLGYLVVYDLGSARLEKRKPSLQTRMILSVSAVLIVGGAALFYLLERNNPSTLANLPGQTQILASLFQSITTRTAGFNTVDIGSCEPATQQFLMVLMLVGGAPGSTAGGIKVTTLGVLLVAVWNYLNGRRDMMVGERKIPPQRVVQAVAVLWLMTSLIWISSSAMNLLDGHDFLETLFETVSAAATVGLSTGITGSLSTASKLWLCLVMFAGRVGPLTLATALLKNKSQSKIDYISEDVSVG